MSGLERGGWFWVPTIRRNADDFFVSGVRQEADPRAETVTVRNVRRIQPVDATHSLNISAGVC